MANTSITPPPTTNGGKWLILLLLLLGGGAAAWYALGRGDSKQQAATEVPDPAPEPTKREAFDPTLELPDLDASVPDANTDASQVGDSAAGDDGQGGDGTNTKKKSTKNAKREVQCNGSLEVSQIRSVINGAARNQVRACYERRLKDNNLLEGSMNLLITIGSNGRVRSTNISGTLRDNRVYSCVRNVARTWQFPRPDGGCVRTSVPFMMTPAP